jgi:hypothetical protein
MRRFRVEALAFLLPFWLFGPLFFSSSVFNETAPLHFEYAEKKWFFENLAQGNWALLYPFNELGHGLLNNPASGLLFLPNWLHAVLPYALAFKLIFYGFFLVLFFGLRRLLGHFTSRERASGIALVGMAVGIVTSLPLHVGLGYVSFFPWAIVSVLELRSGQGRILQTAFTSSALFLLGDPFLIPVAWLAGAMLAPQRVQWRAFGPALMKVAGVVALVCLPHLWFMILNAPFNSRALGIVPWEALSYSTAPIRILDWLFPWAQLYDVKSSLGEGFHLGWWFPRIGGGLALTALGVLGLKQASPRQRWVLGGWLLLLGLLALGQFFAPSAVVMKLLPLRYPERFLAYLLPAVLILAALGVQSLRARTAVIVLAIALLENVVAPLRPALTSLAVSDVPRDVWVGEELHQTRYLSCPQGLDGDRDFTLFDVRAHQIPMVNGTSNTRSAALKVTSCPWALSPHVQHWLGIGHVLSSGDAGAGEKWGLVKVATMSGGEIFRAQGSPWVGRGVRAFEASPFITVLPPSTEDVRRLGRLAEEGMYFIDPRWSLVDGWPGRKHNNSVAPWSCTADSLSLIPSPTQQSFEMKVPAGCSGLVNVPWAFQAGWITEPPSEVLRINDGTLGLQLPAGVSQLRLSFRPRGAVALVVFSVLLQLAMLATIVVGFFKKK